MPNFSIVTIVRNEEQNLPKLLQVCESFLSAGGNLVIADTGSTDSTRTIAADWSNKYPKSVHLHELGSNTYATFLTKQQARKINAGFVVGSDAPIAVAGQRIFQFDDARNAAQALAANDFVLQLDASDTLDAFDWAKLDTMLHEQAAAAADDVALSVQCLYFYDAVESNDRRSRREVQMVRLYDRRTHKWEGMVHEHIVVSAVMRPQRQLQCPPDLLTIRHVRNADKPRNYEAGLALERLQRKKGHSRVSYHLGALFFVSKRYRSAVQQLQKCIELPETLDPLRSQAGTLLGRCLDQLEEPERAADAFWKAFMTDPTRRETLLDFATMQLRRKQYQQAVCYSLAALGIPHRPSWVGEELINYQWRPHKLLYDALTALGRTDEAAIHYKQAARYINGQADQAQGDTENSEDGDGESNCDCESCTKSLP